MALVRIYNPKSQNFAYAPESALSQMPKWRRARPDDKPRATKKAPGTLQPLSDSKQASTTTKKTSGAQASAAENKENS